MSTSNSSSRQRSLFRDSYENRNKREEIALKKMDETTSEYLRIMEDGSGFFGAAGVEEFQGDGSSGGNQHGTDVVVPRFEPNEIELQTTIGMGEFGVVLNVLKICLNPQMDDDKDNDNEGDETSSAGNENYDSGETSMAASSESRVLWLSAKQNHPDHIETNRILREGLANSRRGRRTNGFSAPVSSRDVSADSIMVIKQIRKDLYPNKRIEAAKDLAREAKFLARLQQLQFSSESPEQLRTGDRNNHPNIITLRGIVSNPGSPDFGILLDRLHLTLDELSISWGNYQEKLLERHSSHSSQKRGIALPLTLTQWWRSSDQAVGAALGKITKNVGGFFRWGEDDRDGRGDASVGKKPSEPSPPDALLLLGERLLALWDVAEGMGHLHKHRILLRDLKPENVGRNVRWSGGARGRQLPQSQQRMQIFDFGLAKECKPMYRIGPPSLGENGSKSGNSIGFYDHYKMSGLTGTRRIMAPEVIWCKPYGLPADVYSYGICLWEIFSGAKCSFLSPAQISDREPWVRPEPPLIFDDDDDDHDDDDHDDSIDGGTKRYKSACFGMPRRLQALMERCWHEDPRRRPSFPEISAILRSVLGQLARQPRRMKPEPTPSYRLSYESTTSSNNINNMSIFSKAASDGRKYLVSPWRTCVNGNGSGGVGGRGGNSFLTTMIENTSSKRRQKQQQQQQQLVDDSGEVDVSGTARVDQAGVWSRLEILRESGRLDG